MVRCHLCYDLEKKEEDDFRFACDFAPEQLLRSANVQKCISCALILEGILCFEDESWSFNTGVIRVYAYAHSSAIEDDTLSVELYFNDERPKLILEFFHREKGYRESESKRPFHSTI